MQIGGIFAAAFVTRECKRQGGMTMQAATQDVEWTIRGTRGSTKESKRDAFPPSLGLLPGSLCLAVLTILCSCLRPASRCCRIALRAARTDIDLPSCLLLSCCFLTALTKPVHLANLSSVMGAARSAGSWTTRGERSRASNNQTS